MFWFLAALRFHEILRAGHLNAQDMNRAIDEAGVELPNLVCVRFVGSEAGAALTLDITLDGVGLSAQGVVAKAASLVEAHSFSIIDQLHAVAPIRTKPLSRGG